MWQTRSALPFLVAIALQWSFCAVAHADELSLTPSAASACLTRAPGAPATPSYPPALFERKEGDRIRVELEFSHRDQAPKVTVDDEVHNQDFINEVRRFASFYRVPCLSDSAAPVVLRQSFEFSPTDGRKVMPPAPRDANEEARLAQMKCIVHNEKASRPSYPKSALRDEQEDKMPVRFRFTDAASPPEVTFLARPRHHALRTAIETYAAGLRMPCLAGGPNSVERIFDFHLLGGARKVLKDLSLVELLGSSRDIALPAYFDLNAMACPFDVRFIYQRPYLLNEVLEVETSHPARQTLLAWLSKFTINFSEANNRQAIGQAITVTIPCGKIDLKEETEKL